MLLSSLLFYFNLHEKFALELSLNLDQYFSTCLYVLRSLLLVISIAIVNIELLFLCYRVEIRIV